jgi:hypothetical protein
MRRLLAMGCCGVVLALPAAAWGAGGALPPFQGAAGVSASSSGVRYVALPAGHDTVVAQVRRLGGAVRRTRLLHGRLGTAAVGADGSATGLSADGRTLVLQPIVTRYPPRSTRLVVLHARRLRPAGEVRLRGHFAVDAISPGGRWLYLLHYTDPGNVLRYEVRAYDLAQRRLVPAPVVDPREPDEKMLGIPVTRTSSADGRWAYTLYQRPSEAPFIHALDTQGRAAFCVDLPTLGDGDIAQVRLRLASGEGTLRVVTAAGPQALVDTRTFAVRPPDMAPSRPGEPARSDGGVPWIPAAALAAALAGLAAFARTRRRPPHAPPA